MSGERTTGTLHGRTIVVTRPKKRAEALARPLEELGAAVLIAAVIEIIPPSNYAPLDLALERLRQFQWIVLTSAEGVDALIERLMQRSDDVRSLKGLRIAAIGPKTSARLREFGLIADLTPDSFRAEDLAEALIAAGVAGQTVLVARSEISRPELVDLLVAAGAFVDEVASYSIEPAASLPSDVAERLGAGEIDMVAFTSPSTVESFLTLSRQAGLDDAVQVVGVACIGTVTAEAAVSHGLEPLVVASEFTVDGLVAAIAEHYRVESRGRR